MYWEEEYIHILIERNLVDVLSLLASTEARDETSALVDTPTRIEAGHEIDASKQRLLLYTRRRKKHTRSSLRRSTMNASRRN